MFLIYKISNLLNNKVYIGQTVRPLMTRFNEHCHIKSRCTHISNAIKKYGKSNFQIELLTISHVQEIADYWETYFINKYDSLSRKFGYNIRDGGKKGAFNNKGRKHTPEELRKMSETQKGRKISDETKLKMSLAKKDFIPWNKGKHSVINQYVKYPKITNEQKEAIKIDTRAGRVIAKEYGISKTTVYRIKNERL